MRQYQITRAAELEALPALREFIENACQGHPGISPEALYDLKLSVDEACTNIITHGYAGMNPGSVMVSLTLGPQQVTMCITDFGHPFEPSAAPRPDLEAALEDRPMGGFGLFFIYETMDEVDYETSEDGNCLTLVKRIDTSAGD